MNWLPLALVLIAGPAAAAVVEATPNGFEVQATTHVAATPEAVYAALIRPSGWWSSDHTYSGDAANLSLEAKAGGCWCERLQGGGGVQHLVVVYAVPGSALRVRGALGPLQGLGVEGALTWTIKPAAGGGSDVTQTYVVGGFAPGGLAALAAPVDTVLGEQLARLKSSIETGEPAPG
jgi:uncharacterized protein YndB with AHSA1/START domain